MKKLFALCLLLLPVLYGCGKGEKVEYHVVKTSLEQETGNITRTEKTYDESWNLLLDQVTLDGRFANRTEYEYSEDHSLVTIRSTSAIYDPETLQVRRSFDENGQILLEELYEDDRHIRTSEYTYDAAGNTVKAVTAYPQPDPEAQLVITLQRIYDSKNNLVTAIEDTGYLHSRTEYTYDRKNRCIREAYYKNEALTDICEFTWKDCTARGIHRNADGTHSRSLLLEYDDAGNLLVKEVTYPDGRLQSRTCYEYAGTDGSMSGSIAE